MGVKIQTTIETSPDIISLHAPPHVEEHMAENHSRRRLGIFGRLMKTHAPSKKRVSVETDGASCDARDSWNRGKTTKTRPGGQGRSNAHAFFGRRVRRPKMPNRRLE